MKEIKAFIHRSRIADVVTALKTAGFDQMSFIDVQGTLEALDSKEKGYSLEIGQQVVTEMKLELVCEDSKMDNAISIIRKMAKTNRAPSGWLYVSEVTAVKSKEN